MRCQLPDCQKAVQRTYEVNVRNYNLKFCSSDHARTGVGRWMEKEKKGIRPGVPQRKEEVEMIGDNMDEIEGGDQL